MSTYDGLISPRSMTEPLNSFQQLRKPPWYVSAPGELSNKLSRFVASWDEFEMQAR
jgi:hypothetical protein